MKWPPPTTRRADGSLHAHYVDTAPADWSADAEARRRYNRELHRLYLADLRARPDEWQFQLGRKRRGLPNTINPPSSAL